MNNSKWLPQEPVTAFYQSVSSNRLERWKMSPYHTQVFANGTGLDIPCDLQI